MNSASFPFSTLIVYQLIRGEQSMEWESWWINLWILGLSMAFFVHRIYVFNSGNLDHRFGLWSNCSGIGLFPAPVIAGRFMITHLHVPVSLVNHGGLLLFFSFYNLNFISYNWLLLIRGEVKFQHLYAKILSTILFSKPIILNFSFYF